MIRCHPSVLAAIAAHARRVAPEECCGLLLGTPERIEEARPLENHAADPFRRYEIDPRDFLALIKQCRGTARAVIGAYHSHPQSAARPSAADRAEAVADFLYVIAGPVSEEAEVAIEGYRLEGGNFCAVRLVPEPEEP